ncbi:hypothetical protein JYB88_10220 [Shewanella cyperi]|uniref:Uncharacterized protein n=1 Tax=Shewanella cyperi TaxID=2814292 RepID=A0A975AJ35_9GAMM|nr:hypothetical protein [Shewanella cyperi]QSX28665.1 hypothetical protein JYB88_10220 [Shewanella cyperi]
MISRSALKAILASLILSGSAFANADTPSTVPQTIQDALIEWAASNFSEHGPSVAGVQNVHVRVLTLANGETGYLLCGEFHTSTAGPGAEWTHFATIKTDPYEQWIGGLGESQCEHATPSTTPPQDLSTELQARLSAAKIK